MKRGADVGGTRGARTSLAWILGATLGWSESALAQAPVAPAPPADAPAASPAASPTTPAPAPPPAGTTPRDVSSDSPEGKAAALTSADANEKVRAHFNPVVGRAGGLQVDEAARQAALVSPEARAAGARVDAAQASVNEVKWQYIPRLTLSASYTRLSPQPNTTEGLGGNLVATADGPGPLPADAQLVAIDATQAFQQVTDQWYLNAGLVVPLSDYLLNLSKAISGARTLRDSAELNERAERLTSAANARIAYYDWARAKLTAREATKSVERARRQLEVLEAQREVGSAARADVLRADAFLATTELSERRAWTQEANLRERLHVLMTGGGTKTPEWEIGDDVLAESNPKEFESLTIEQMQAEALEHRLEVRALELRAKAQRDQAAVERSNAYPKLEAFGNLTYANPNQRIVPQIGDWAESWDVGARVTWTLNDLGRGNARAATAEADAGVTDADRARIEFALRQEVASERRIYQESALATASSKRGFVAAEAAYEDRVVLFESGRATSLDLLEAETSLVEARTNLVAAYIAQRISRVRLEHALGRDATGDVPARPRSSAAKKDPPKPNSKREEMETQLR